MPSSPAGFVETRHLALHFAHFGAGLEVIALVAVGLASAGADFGFHLAIFPVKAQKGEGKAFLGLLDFQLQNLALVHEQAAGALGLVLEPLAGGFPGLHVAAVQEKLPLLHAGEGISHVHLAGADGFHLGAAQFDAALVPAHDFVITACFLVTGDEVALRGGFLGHMLGGGGG